MSRFFYGGIHPDDGKRLASGSPIKVLEAPEQVVIPMSMHIGAECTPVVTVGDKVLLGQVIGSSTAFVSAPVHATVSGTVAAIEPRLHPNGRNVMSVIIDNDGQDTLHESVVSHVGQVEADASSVLDIVKNTGIVGMGGAAFPTHVKISSGLGKVDTMIVNAAECEPFITADHRVLLEQPEEVLAGISYLRRMLGLEKAYLAIEANKHDAIKLLGGIVRPEDGVEIRVLKTRYPQGAEKQLIQTITGRQVPPGGLPADVGCIVFNDFTCWSVNRAVKTGIPAIERVVTVSGPGIVAPGNYMCRVGTPISKLIEAAGGLKENVNKIIMGGPMMGNSVYSTDVPVIKGTNAVIALGVQDNKSKEEPMCIRCGRCVSACPMHLQPIYLYAYANKGDAEALARLRVTDCIECGCCAYTCPGRLQIVQAIKDAKILVRNRK